MLTCKKCQRELDEGFFRKDLRLRSGYRFTCKLCRPYTEHDRKTCKAYRIAHREQGVMYMRTYRAHHGSKIKVRDRNTRLTTAYGINLKEWEKIFEQQGRKCAICGATSPGKQNWRTDHNHVTGQVRGILCNSCNTSLGLFDEDIQRIQCAIDYVTKQGVV